MISCFVLVALLSKYCWDYPETQDDYKLVSCNEEYLWQKGNKLVGQDEIKSKYVQHYNLLRNYLEIFQWAMIMLLGYQYKHHTK